MKVNSDKPEKQCVRPLKRSDLSDRIAYVMPTREFVDEVFKSDSELDKTIVRLVLYCTRFMSYDKEIMTSEHARTRRNMAFTLGR